jgi:molecular chaperone GrpE
LPAAQREAAELKDKLLRTLAEMENLRRRTEREVADSRVYGIAFFARDVLTVADNMQRGAAGAR